LRKKIEGGELLKDPYRIRCAQDRYRAREPYPARSCRCRSENDRGGGIEELPTVVLPDPEDVQSSLIGVFDLFHKVAQPIRRADRKAGLVERRREAIDPDLHSRPRSLVEDMLSRKWLMIAP
jgi:hypothetical protein